ncbi:MAG: TolB family protein [Cyclobacteriaceae bacterium]
MNQLLISLWVFLAIFSAPKLTTNKDFHQKEAFSRLTADSLKYPKESHFANIRQLTFGGNNAEAYFSSDGQHLVFQSDYDQWGLQCDQIFTMPVDQPALTKPVMLSTGKGRTTCSYFLPDSQTIVYASTHLGNVACPETPRMVNGKYVWPIYDSFDIFTADLNGNILHQLTDHPGYDAEATLSPNGQKIVYTSTQSGDLELWTMNIDGSEKKQITDGLGYDGGAFFSPDSRRLIFRASRPETPEAQKVYKDLLNEGVVQPTEMELFICNADGSDLKQLTNLGGANWAPFFHPSGEKVLFASNHKSASGRGFNLFMMDLNDDSIEQITYDPTFDAFPMFSPDGSKLVFSSNRNNGGTRDTNIFIADWVD